MVFVWDYGAIDPKPEVIRQDIGFVADYVLKWTYAAVSSWSSCQMQLKRNALGMRLGARFPLY